MFKNIKSIQNWGVFKDAKTNADQPFHQFNLFYGFNYSGKTTLSRIFQAMEHAEILDEFKTGSFEIEKHDGISIKSNSIKKIENLRVFNSDYITKNVNFNESSVNPVLIVGEKNIELEEELKQLEKAISIKEKERSDNIEFAEKKEKEKDSRLSEVGRSVSQLNILGKSTFNSTAVKSMLKNAVSFHELTQEQIGSFSDTARASAAYHVQKATIYIPEMADLLADIKELMNVSVTQITIIELENNNKLRDWVENGIEHYKDNDTCPFCKNTIANERLDELNSYFSKSYKDLTQSIDSKIILIKNESFSFNIPDTSKLYSALQIEFDELRKKIEPHENTFKSLKISLIKLLTDKKNHMAEIIPFNILDYPTPDLTSLLNAFNKLIDEHNTRSSNHSSEQKNAIEVIKQHYVYQEKQQYDHDQASSEILNFKNKVTLADENIAKNKAEIEILNSTQKNITQGAQNLNNNLRQYFGKSDIEIRAVGDSYKFMRENREARHLSDGERTAIAFAYFITQLEDESLKNLKPIVYLDDPICSLDSNHIYNVIGIIKNKLNHEHVEQLFISTHNFEFFNMLKMWMSYYSGTQGSLKRAEYFLISRKNNESQICALPVSLKNCRSEYAYLISKVKEAIHCPHNCDSISVQSYVRKIMEVYFSFRFNLNDFRKDGNNFIASSL